MTKEIATTLAGLAPRELVGIVSQWSTMPIKERIAAASKFSFLAWLRKSLDVLPPYSVLELKRFAKDCGVTAEVYLDVDRNCRVSLARETRKYYSIVSIDPLVSTVDEFDNCIRLILTNYLMQPEQALAIPGGSK